MKKIIFSLAALMVVAMTVVFTSCDNDSSDTIMYSYGTTDFHLKNTDKTAWVQVEEIYETELKKISGATANGSYLEFDGGSASNYDKQVKQACETAEATISATVTIPSGLSFTYSVKRVALSDKGSDVVIYSKGWGE